MAHTALPAPRPPPRARRAARCRRLDLGRSSRPRSGSSSSSCCSGYLPDRAYYFTVQKTVDIGLLAWSPVNFCPPENEGMPCPVPAGATLPWHTAPEEVRLPAGRTDGAGGVIGQTYIYAGGSDGDQAPSADVYISHAVGTGNLDAWSAGPGAARGARGRRVRRPRQRVLCHRRVRAGRRPHRHRVQPDRRQRRHPARRVGRGGGGQAARGAGRRVRRRRSRTGSCSWAAPTARP